MINFDNSQVKDILGVRAVTNQEIYMLTLKVWKGKITLKFKFKMY